MKPLRFLLAGSLALAAFGALADDPKLISVADLHRDKAGLEGQAVRVQGKVVKVNNGIMGRNFVHVRDGTGDQATNNLIVTSKQTAAVGDPVTITGKVTLNRDFGAGYMYPLLVEEASISSAK